MAVIETGQDNTVDQGAVEEQAKIDQARADLYDEAAGNEPGEPEGSLILGKYKSQSDLVDAYKNLQRENERLRGGEVEQAEEEPEAQQEEPESQLTAEDATRIRGSMFDQVGGAEKYQALMGWASQNLDEGRAASFNEALNSGNEGAILAQLKGIQYDHMMATGYEPKLTGGRAPTQDVRGFASEAQVIAAMQDPRYGNDPAYIKEVEQRIAVSNVFNQR
jgi:hypothetical protein